MELQEKGRVRFWLQADKISANAKVEYVFNDNVLSQGEVSEQKGDEQSDNNILLAGYDLMLQGIALVCRNTR